MQLTVVVPNPKVEPDAGRQLIVGFASHESDAVVVKLTAAPLALVHAVVMFAGHVIVGAVVSVTVTVNEHVRVFTGEA